MSVATVEGWGPSLRKPSALPGFGITFGFTIAYLSLIVLLPLAVLVWRASGLGLDGIWRVATTPRVLAALEVSFFTSAAAAGINAVFGVIVAWVLVRYDFSGKRLLDATVDLPFALPTAVAGIALAALYATNGWIGGLFAPWDIKIAFTPYGILIALVFIGLPFVVRTVQPVLQDFDREVEEASATLGATRWQIFKDVLIWESLQPTFVGLRSAVSMSLVIVIVAEMFIGSDNGLGHRIIDAQQVLNVKSMYAAILAAGALGYGLNILFLIAERRIVHWSGR